MTDSTAVHSNAFNFMSYLQGGVDPRTNQYTLSIEIPEFKTNYLNGPRVPLALSFNPMNLLDTGYGLGWNLSLSQFTPHSQILSLSTGERFKVTAQNGDEQIMREKKLDTFRFYTHTGPDYDYKLVHKSGLIERLKVHGTGNDRIALPVEMLSPEGHKVTLGYQLFNARYWRLEWVSDVQGRLLESRRDAGSLTLDLHPGKGPDGTPLATYSMTLDTSLDKTVRAITLPAAAGQNISWRLNYRKIGDYHCITEVETPLGAREEVDYDTVGHEFPDGSGHRPLPRVDKHRVFPGGDQPMVERRYRYDDSSTYPATNNFLGRNLTLSWTDDGLDNLYKVGGSRYEYGCTEQLIVGGVEVQRIKRTFNGFHLATRETTVRNDKMHEVETTYHLNADASFDSQLPYFQLPFEVIKRWRLAGDATRLRTERSSSTYDSYGNLLVQTQANGIVEANTYYLKEGEPGCPMDPDGFVRHLKSKTVTPAPGHIAGAPVLRTDYRYVAQPSLSTGGRPDWLALERETLVQQREADTELQRTDYTYYTTGEPVVHGRVRQEAVTLNGKTTLTGYEYRVLSSARVGETVLQTVQTLSTDFDSVNKVITLESSLLNGESLLERDDNDVEIRRTYDALNRVTSETVAPDDPLYAATRRYEYYLSSHVNQRAEQWHFDVKDVKTVTTFDGLNRAIHEARADADSAIPTTMRQTYAARYDEFGNLTEETEYDWWDVSWATLKDVPLTTLFLYDDWNQQCGVIRPDGVQEHTQTDPIGDGTTGPVQRTWTSSSSEIVSGVTETQFNLFGKPVQTQRIDLGNTRLSLRKYSYDGLGRTVKEEVGLRSPFRVTEYGYDSFDRMIQKRLPLGAVVRREYAEHSAQDWPTLISVDNQTLGTQVFDGLGRIISSTTGGRLKEFEYEPQQSQPRRVTTPSGLQIGYEYRPTLCEEPVRRQLPGITSLYDYDPANARLLGCNEPGQAVSRTYFTNGELKSEVREHDGQSYEMHYLYSLRGRLLEYIDVLGQKQVYRYDLQGRMEMASLGATTSRFSYDPLGNVASIQTENEVSATRTQKVEIKLVYDEFNRETQRIFDLDGVEQTLTQVYDDVDALTSRSLTEGAEVLREESYGYDLRGRLETYACTGSQPPADAYGNDIAAQMFIFDALDNLTLAITDAADGKNNMAEYFFDNALDPVQLSRVANQGDAGYPTEIQLVYDASGNLIEDEQGRALEYDALNRLLSISERGGGAPRRYGYDPLNMLTQQVDGSETQRRFYCAGELASTIDGERRSSFLRAGGSIVAERQGSDDVLLLAGDRQHSVLSEVGPDGERSLAYSAYGHRNGASAATRLGYNGEIHEETGWQLLGNGYRAYNPVLMRFHSPDDMSPFGAGGINAYAYCSGDPVNFADPTGHFATALVASAVMGVIAVAAGVGAGVVKDDSARIALGVVSAAFGTASLTFGYIGFITPRMTRLANAAPRARVPARARVSSLSDDPLVGAWREAEREVERATQRATQAAQRPPSYDEVLRNDPPPPSYADATSVDLNVAQGTAHFRSNSGGSETLRHAPSEASLTALGRGEGSVRAVQDNAQRVRRSL